MLLRASEAHLITIQEEEYTAITSPFLGVGERKRYSGGCMRRKRAASECADTDELAKRE